MVCIAVMALLPLSAYFLIHRHPQPHPAQLLGHFAHHALALGVRHSGESQKVYCQLQEKESPGPGRRQSRGWGGVEAGLPRAR